MCWYEMGGFFSDPGLSNQSTTLGSAILKKSFSPLMAGASTRHFHTGLTVYVSPALGVAVRYTATLEGMCVARTLL